MARMTAADAAATGAGAPSPPPPNAVNNGRPDASTRTRQRTAVYSKITLLPAVGVPPCTAHREEGADRDGSWSASSPSAAAAAPTPTARRRRRAPRRAAAFSKITVLSVGSPCSSMEDIPTPCGGAYGTPPLWGEEKTTAAAADATAPPPWVDTVLGWAAYVRSAAPPARRRHRRPSAAAEATASATCDPSAAAAPSLRPPATATAVDDTQLDALHTGEWLVDPPPPSMLVRAASDDARADGALEF